jgi:O-antigen biosynthesis protein
MRRTARFLLWLPGVLLCPVLALIAVVALAITDLCWLVLGRPRAEACGGTPKPAPQASIVIPNWNGRDLLEKYLASAEAAAAAEPGSEVIVVDNGSTDGSADFVRERFPGVRLLALEKNLGFGGGSNTGVRAARNDVVVLLNSDMRVATGYLAPLLDGFRDERVFAVSCQIFLSDPQRRREETGLTEGAWRDGGLRVRHRIDPAVTGLYPCFYGGGGSCAFDRRKFLELGGFDPLLRPFYLEDTDLGYLAWKRGWKVLYQPRSAVYHEHRGTIGRHFSPAAIQAVYRKNFVLFAWKNIHEWRKLAAHFAHAVGDSLVSAAFGDSPERTNAGGLWRAFAQLPEALRSRWRARSLAVVSDTEAFQRPLGGYFRDRFELEGARGLPARPRVLFVSPYPICPPVHGGAVFMHSTLLELARACEVHLVCLLDEPGQREAHEKLARHCASAEFLVRSGAIPRALGSSRPHAVREFVSDELDWLIHRQIYTQQIDVVQLDYTPMAQYAGRFERVGTALFEHDIYFQSIARSLGAGGQGRLSAAYEYLRALRWELRALGRVDRVQVCSAANRDYLLSFSPGLAERIDTGLRAAIDSGRYEFRPGDRQPHTMLFVGSQRHLPNRTGLAWFVQEVLPRVLEREPRARLVVVGFDISAHSFADAHIELRGFVEDVREPLGRCAVFVCPVLSGSGMRVKLLEAFAAGIPAVSTRIGAEGLSGEDGRICALADDPAGFADRVLRLFSDAEAGREMARRARSELEANWDSRAVTARLVASYLRLMGEKRGAEAAEKAAISP